MAMAQLQYIHQHCLDEERYANGQLVPNIHFFMQDSDMNSEVVLKQ